MIRPPTFAFQTTPAPGPLLEELEKFFVYWLGPSGPGFGESESALRGQALPDPLRRLYAFAGRWQHPDPESALMTWVLNAGEGFRPLDQLERRRQRGTLFFADECQANWSCATRARARIPPSGSKTLRHDLLPRRRVERSLSRFIVTQSLRVLLAGSRLMVFDDELARWFCASGSEAVPLWTSARFPYYARGISFYLLRQSVLVGDFDQDGIASRPTMMRGSSSYASIRARYTCRDHPDGRELYRTLTIRRDGSARFYVGRRDIDTPPGTFDFGSTRDRLLAASPDVPGGPASWSVAFHCSGQYGQRAAR